MNDQVRKITVIPANPEMVKRQKSNRQLRVAAYCRVSTDDEEQLTSYEAQQAYYTDKIMTNPAWTIAGIFADDTCIIGTNQSPARGRRFVPTFFVFSTLEAAKG